MKRLRHVNGTKQRPRGRQCLEFSVAGYGPLIIDQIHPDQRDEMFERLWAVYGRGNVWVRYRRMKRGEGYRDATGFDVEYLAEWRDDWDAGKIDVAAAR